MVLLFKTLIIFDTNALRHALRTTNKENEGSVVYHEFKFGSNFEDLEKYLQKNYLTHSVELAIPNLVIDEIKRQKCRSYHTDLERLSEIQTLLCEIPFPNRENLQTPDKHFDYQAHMEQMANEYLAGRKIRFIEMPDDNHLKDLFLSIIQRALDYKPPFKQNGKQFKDALIWESILSYPHIKDFEKIILFTDDKGFTGCDGEFKTRFKKYFSIIGSEPEIEVQLDSDYKIFIENQSFVRFSKTDYFRSIIEQQIKGKYIVIGSNAYPITSFNVINPIKSMDSILDADNNEAIVIDSELKIFYAKPDGQSETSLVISTFFDESNAVVDVRFDKELLEQ